MIGHVKEMYAAYYTCLATSVHFFYFILFFIFGGVELVGFFCGGRGGESQVRGSIVS